MSSKKGFKKGDRVVCIKISHDYHRLPIKNETYTVTGEFSNTAQCFFGPWVQADKSLVQKEDVAFYKDFQYAGSLTKAVYGLGDEND